MNLLATLGVLSKDPEVRRPAGVFLAFRARDEVLEHEQRQTRALEALVRRQTTDNVASPPSPNSASVENVTAGLLEQIKRRVGEWADHENFLLYEDFVRRQGLAGDASTFAIGAAHIGYCTRLAEEDLDPELLDGTPLAMRVVRSLAEQDPNASEQDIAVRASAAFAHRKPWEDTVLDALALPGPARGVRSQLRDAGLTLLPRPGASFHGRPRGITVEQGNAAWAFGYALRVVQQSA